MLYVYFISFFIFILPSLVNIALCETCQIPSYKSDICSFNWKLSLTTFGRFVEQRQSYFSVSNVEANSVLPEHFEKRDAVHLK